MANNQPERPSLVLTGREIAKALIDRRLVPTCRPVLADLPGHDPGLTRTAQSTFRGAFPSRIPPGDIGVCRDLFDSMLPGNEDWLSPLPLLDLILAISRQSKTAERPVQCWAANYSALNSSNDC